MHLSFAERGFAGLVTLRFATIDDAGTARRGTLVQALDEDGAIVASYSLAMMAAWLQRHGYHWVTASNGLWRRPA